MESFQFDHFSKHSNGGYLRQNAHFHVSTCSLHRSKSARIQSANYNSDDPNMYVQCTYLYLYGRVYRRSMRVSVWLCVPNSEQHRCEYQQKKVRLCVRKVSKELNLAALAS